MSVQQHYLTLSLGLCKHRHCKTVNACCALRTVLYACCTTTITCKKDTSQVTTVAMDSMATHRLLGANQLSDIDEEELSHIGHGVAGVSRQCARNHPSSQCQRRDSAALPQRQEPICAVFSQTSIGAQSCCRPCWTTRTRQRHGFGSE